jgi:hypothetical protein
MVACTDNNFSIQEAEAGRAQVGGQSGPHSEILAPNQTRKIGCPISLLILKLQKIVKNPCQLLPSSVNKTKQKAFG